MKLDSIKQAATEQVGRNSYSWIAPDVVLGLIAEIERQSALLNAPELHDFGKGVVLEAAHQRERWGAEHDAGKSPLDWFWLIGYLAQKAAFAQIAGDMERAAHHTISTGAALANWHSHVIGASNLMRPGIAAPKLEATNA